MSTRTTSTRVKHTRGAVVAIGAATALAAGQVGAAAAALPFDRGIDDACEASAQEADEFADVDATHTHATAINCLWAYGVVQGQFTDGEHVYSPGVDVNREQMASFIAVMLDQLPNEVYALPAADDGPDFTDAGEISTAHQANIDRLQQAGIISGHGDGTFRPAVTIDRAQMATFIAQAIEAAIDDELMQAEGEPFQDVSGTHQANIEKLTQAGIVQGETRTTYGPQASTTRAQMATMIARSLDFFVFEGYLEPVAFSPATAPSTLGITDVDTGAHDDVDRVTFTLAGDDALAGWTVRYIDGPVAHGSGESVEVDGDAVLEVTLTGMALPPDLDEDLWDDERISVDGDGIVEIVNRSVFEGRQQIFIGTTGINGFSVDRLSDPQRVYIDVEHGS